MRDKESKKNLNADIADFINFNLTEDEERDFKQALQGKSYNEKLEILNLKKKDLIKASKAKPLKKWPWYYPLRKGYAWKSPKYSVSSPITDNNHKCHYHNLPIRKKILWALEVIINPKQWMLHNDR